MTEKLFYQNSYQREFIATVLQCEKKDENFFVVLDKTAFYPVGGGQDADTGILGDSIVIDVHEKEGTIYHTTSAPLLVGQAVTGRIDWQKRFSRMQQHTGEHIVSGIIKQEFQFDNVGFHMGSSEKSTMTIDINGTLSVQDIQKIEQLANEAVWANIPLEIDFPSPQQLLQLDYRSKKELEGEVRIVKIPGYDCCACCGTHVKYTGEIGVIKLICIQHYKGGTRISLACGDRALKDYSQKNEQIQQISNSLSAKTEDVFDAVKKLIEKNEYLNQHIYALREELFQNKVKEIPEGTEFSLLFDEGLTSLLLQKFAVQLAQHCNIGAVFSKKDNDGYQYALASKQTDVRPIGKQINDALQGKGGGKAELVQGAVAVDKKAIERFFQEGM